MRLVCGAVAAGLLLSSAAAVEAGGRACRPRSKARANVVIRLDTGLTIVPFVATTQVLVIREPAFFYAYSTYAPPAAASAALPETTASADPQGSVERDESLVVRTCGKCHGGAAPAGGFDLADFSRLTAADRLHAVARVVSDDAALRMPRGRTLSPAEIGALVQEFARQAGAPAEDSVIQR